MTDTKINRTFAARKRGKGKRKREKRGAGKKKKNNFAKVKKNVTFAVPKERGKKEEKPEAIFGFRK